MGVMEAPRRPSKAPLTSVVVVCVPSAAKTFSFSRSLPYSKVKPAANSTPSAAGLWGPSARKNGLSGLAGWS